MQRNVETTGEKWNKKELKKSVNKLIIGVLVYELIMFVVVTLDMFRRIGAHYFKYNVVDTVAAVDKVISEAISSGTSSIISVFVGLLFLGFYFRKCDYRKMIFNTKEKMIGSSFVVALTFFMFLQVIFSFLNVVMEAGFNKIGFSILGDITSATSNSSTLSMLLYASLIGPITEEIVFRGFLIRGLQKYGTCYAIIISAIIFGAFHGNLIQNIFAFFVGLVLGYVTMKYSIKWAVLLHIINNFIFGDLLSYITSNMSDSTQSVITNILQAFSIVGISVILVMRKDKMKSKLKEIFIDKKMLGVTFTSFWMLIFLTLQLLLTISGIEKLS